MKKTILFLFLGVCLFLFISDLHAMECQIVDGEGNAIDSVAAGEVLYFKNTYSYMKSKKLSWSLTIVLPSTDIKNNKTSIKYSGYFYHSGSTENKTHIIPIAIPADTFIQGIASFKYTLSNVGTRQVYLEITQDLTPPELPHLSVTAMDCSIVDEEGNVISSVAAGDLFYFKNTYSYSKSKKLSWSLTIVLPSTDIKNNKTSIKYSGYFYHQPSIENNSHIIPLVIPAHNFIQGSATFQYKLSSVGTCKIYLEITKEMTPPRQSNLSATAVFPDRVELSWNEPFDNAEVVGYNIYDSNGSYLTSINKPSTYFDGLSVNNVYCYSVTAYDSAGNESEHSNKACATIYAEEKVAKLLLLLGSWKFILPDGKEKIYSLTTINYRYNNVMYLTSKYNDRVEAEYLYSGRWYLEEDLKWTLTDWDYWSRDEYYFYTDGYTILPNSYYYECSSLFCGYGPDIYNSCCLAKEPFSGYKLNL